MSIYRRDPIAIDLVQRELVAHQHQNMSYHKAALSANAGANLQVGSDARCCRLFSDEVRQSAAGGFSRYR